MQSSKGEAILIGTTKSGQSKFYDCINRYEPHGDMDLLNDVVQGAAATWLVRGERLMSQPGRYRFLYHIKVAAALCTASKINSVAESLD